MDPDVSLRPTAAEDWEVLREVRLRALAEAPDAFGSTLAQADEVDEAGWRSRAAGPGPTLLALSGGRGVAMGGLFLPEGAAEAFVWGMWTDPAHRGRGIGDALLGRLVAEGAAAARPVVLHVTLGNDGARRFYERHGFVGTGVTEPLRPGSDRRIELMRHAAGHAPATG